MLKVSINKRKILTNHLSSYTILSHVINATTDILGLPRVHVLHAVEHIVFRKNLPVLRILT